MSPHFFIYTVNLDHSLQYAIISILIFITIIILSTITIIVIITITIIIIGGSSSSSRR